MTRSAPFDATDLSDARPRGSVEVRLVDLAGTTGAAERRARITAAVRGWLGTSIASRLAAVADDRPGPLDGPLDRPVDAPVGGRIDVLLAAGASSISWSAAGDWALVAVGRGTRVGVALEPAVAGGPLPFPARTAASSDDGRMRAASRARERLAPATPGGVDLRSVVVPAGVVGVVAAIGLSSDPHTSLVALPA